MVKVWYTSLSQKVLPYAEVETSVWAEKSAHRSDWVSYQEHQCLQDNANLVSL